MLRLRRLALLLLLPLGGRLSGQPSVGRVTGAVRDGAGEPLAGAEVVVGARRAVTGDSGTFRLDSVPVGQHAVVVRRIGYSPLRSRLAVGAGPVEVEWVLTRVPQLLAPSVTEVARAGIYGVVGDTTYRKLVGARVQLLGPHTFDVRTDSAGRFAFPDVVTGQYVLRVTQRGFGERRTTIDIRRGEGRDYVFLLAPSAQEMHMRANVAALDLARRMNMGLRRERLLGAELARYGPDGGCAVASRILAEIGTPPKIVYSGTYSGNGSTLSEILCSQPLDGLEMIEFGRDVCREVTGTIAELVHVSCGGSRMPRVVSASGVLRMAPPRRPVSYVVIWERK